MNKEDYIFKIVLLGNSGVGKTSLVSQYILDKYSLYQETTIGVDFKTKASTLPNGDEVKFFIWDTAGQEKFYSIITSYYKNVCGAIIVYDITNLKSFHKVEFWMDEVMKYKEHDNIDIPLLLFGNKTDMNHNRLVTTAMGQSLAKKYNLLFVEGSVEDKEKVNSVFNMLSDKIYSTYIEKEIAKKGLKYKYTYQKNSKCGLGGLCKGCSSCENNNVTNDNLSTYRKNMDCEKCIIL
jgi:small GTP-binding protein